MMDAEILLFMDSLQRAKEYGLEYEFLFTFFQYSSTEPFDQRIFDALYEWDL